MVCPYCNNDMVKGRLVSSRKVTWEHPTIVMYSTNNIVLPGSSFWYGANVTTYHCENCKKMIIDYGLEAE